MRMLIALKVLNSMQTPLFRTSDFAMAMSISNKYAYKLLKQLSENDHIYHLKRDLWGLTNQVNLLMVPDYLTAPMPSYISLHSALYVHGLISQIPATTYAVTTARTRQYTTPLGMVSTHNIKPELFIGYSYIPDKYLKIATPEKALFDYFYFKPAKSKLFYGLPEVDIPSEFNWLKLREYSELVANPSRKKMLLNLIDDYCK